MTADTGKREDAMIIAVQEMIEVRVETAGMVTAGMDAETATAGMDAEMADRS